MDGPPGVLCVELPPSTVVGVTAPRGGAVKPESKGPGSILLPEASPGLNGIQNSCMSVVSKLDQDGFANESGPGGGP